jgi:hypothetical protein
MPKLKTELKGLKEATATLRNLRQSARNKVLRPAITKALRPLRQAIKEQIRATAADSSSGTLAKNIAQKVTSGKKGIVGRVGGRSDVQITVTRPDGSITTEIPSKILHLANNGRKALTVVSKKVMVAGGKNPSGRAVYGIRVKAAPGKHFMENAWASTKDQAEQIAITEIATGFAKIAAAKGRG